MFCAAHPSEDMPRRILAEAIGVIGGVERKIHFFAMEPAAIPTRSIVWRTRGDNGSILRRTRTGVRLLRRRATSILYDNTKIAVARILGDANATERACSASCNRNTCSRDRFGRPGKGNDKGRLKGSSLCRRNFLVPIPVSQTSKL